MFGFIFKWIGFVGGLIIGFVVGVAWGRQLLEMLIKAIFN